MYITRLTSKEIFSPSNKIHWEIGRIKELSAPLLYLNVSVTAIIFGSQKKYSKNKKSIVEVYK